MRFIPLQNTRPRPSSERATTTRSPTLTSVSAPTLTEVWRALDAPHPDLVGPYVIEPHDGDAVPETRTGAFGSRDPHRSSPTGRTDGVGDPRSQSGSTYCQPVSM